jgi:hypothetical protein
MKVWGKTQICVEFSSALRDFDNGVQDWYILLFWTSSIVWILLKKHVSEASFASIFLQGGT